MISPRTLHADPGALVATPLHQTLLCFDNPEIGSDVAVALGRLATQEKLGAHHRLAYAASPRCPLSRSTMIAARAMISSTENSASS